MKIVINVCYGGFGLTDEAKKVLGIEYSDDIERTDSRLIEMVEKDVENIQGRCAKLEIAEIPNESTDWEIEEYDGLENVIYVVNGKIHRAFGEGE